MTERRRSVRRIAHLTALSTAAALAFAGADGAFAAIGARAPRPVAAGTGLADVDLRFAGTHVAPSAAQRAALKALGDVEVGWTPLAVPHSLRRRDGGPLTAPSAAAPDAVARGFLRDNAVLFRQRPSDVARLRLTMEDADRGATFLRYEQTHGDRAVHGSSLLVVLDQQRRVRLAGGTLAPSLGAVLPPAIGADDAVRRAGADVRPGARLAAPRRLASRLTGDLATTFENTVALHPNARPVEATLVTVPAATGGRPAWRVRADVASNAEYDLLVDGTTGQVVYRANQWSSSEPHGLVHTGDDPEAGPQVAGVSFDGIDGSWSAVDSTVGNNTLTYQDLNDDETNDAGDAPVNADRHFDYAFTDEWGTTGVLPVNGDEDRDAVVTQLFYYTNWFHDYVYDLGFTETSRNFQTGNFGRGGAGNDPVHAQSDDSYGTGVELWCQDSNGNAIVCRNNANFNSGGADGTPARMQMYVGDDDGRRTQRAMNRDTVIHEYVHGVTGRIISNGNLAGGLQSEALGEGWSDALATSINDDPVYGEYNNGNYDTGIRGVDYSDSDREYDDLCMLHPSGCQEHADGTIWASVMWEAREALVAKHGFALGKSLHEDLLVLGMKATPDTPSFHDARTGYLVADQLLDLFNVPGAGNQCVLWRVFADNQLGVVDTPDSDSDSSPTLSDETPEACSPEADIASGLVTTEGTDLALDGTGSTVGGDSGDTLSYAWDLDGDGDFDDSTSATPTFTMVGQDGSFPVALRVTNTSGYTDEATATVTVTNAAPALVGLAADGPKPEGSLVTLTGLARDAGWLDGLDVTVSWGDGSPVENLTGAENVRPDATLPIAATHAYGDNGAYSAQVCVSDDDTSSCQNVSVSVTNVAPTVTLDPALLTELREGDSLPVLATFTDPGWLDTYPAATVDPGHAALPAVPGTVTVTDEGPPLDRGTVAATVTYGDNGTFTVSVSLADDDGGIGSDSANVLVRNVSPTAAVDETGAVSVNGVPTFFADEGETLPFSARVTDPGSDDETTGWTWDDGTASTPVKSRVNAAFDDALPSPEVLPRDFTTADAHAFAMACMYDVSFAALDDDAGSGTDTVKVLVTGTPALSRGAGYWQHQYKGNGGVAFTPAELDCYLAIAGHLSTVFDEVRDASTRQQAYDDIFVAGLHGDMSQQLDRQLLTALLNFANGGVEYTELLDTNGDLLPDTSFVDVLANAEAVRRSATATSADLQRQRDVLTRINERDRV